jgi:hypothetical protein
VSILPNNSNNKTLEIDIFKKLYVDNLFTDINVSLSDETNWNPTVESVKLPDVEVDTTCNNELVMVALITKVTNEILVLLLSVLDV